MRTLVAVRGPDERAAKEPGALAPDLVRPLHVGSRFVLAEHRCPHPPSGSRFVGRLERPTLGFVLRGLGKASVGGTRLHMDGNQVALLPTSDEYRVQHVGCERRACAVMLNFSAELFNEALEDHGVRPRASAPRMLPRGPRTRLLLHRLLREAAPEESDRLRVEELGFRLLDCCLDDAASPQRRQGGRSAAARVIADRARELLAERLCERLELSDVAAEVGCSPFHLCHAFKAATGTSVFRYLHRLRINEALVRIHEGAVDLSGLAFDLGFASHSHFTSIFHREVGRPPSQVRFRRR
jgi:AraC family transcriptional regulator